MEHPSLEMLAVRGGRVVGSAASIFASWMPRLPSSRFGRSGGWARSLPNSSSFATHTSPTSETTDLAVRTGAALARAAARQLDARDLHPGIHFWAG
ncbi:hypothetical protein, partial [Salinibacterium sp.]|uniref:hypothetical protein n=1 Tax=Salinibacterium sp. TaxID=1915057 RepID=UPI00286A73CA